MKVYKTIAKMHNKNYILLFLFIYILTYKSVKSQNVTNENEIPQSFLNILKSNSLWSSLITDCKKEPTSICVQNNVYKYFKDTLSYEDDVQFTSFMKFAKNNLDYSKVQKYIKNLNRTYEDYVEEDISSPMRDMSRSLEDNTMKFLMTHDLELQLPETVFEGATLKLSPRSLEGNGALIKMEFLPKMFESQVQGRTIKKIKKFIGERLMYALMAILMVIKLLSVKFLFILPAVMGVAAAKKLIFKLLLFLFPAMHHLFKWCQYVPHGVKFHHHKHLINHVHNLGGAAKPHGHYEVIAPHADGPPSLHHSFNHDHEHQHPHKLFSEYPEGLDWSSQGPAFSGDYITHRQDPLHLENEIQPWGHGYDNRRSKPDFNRPKSVAEIENMVLRSEKEEQIKNRLKAEKLRVQEENLRLQMQLNNAIKLQEKLKHQQQQKLFHQQPYNPKTPGVYLESPVPSVSPYSANIQPPPQTVVYPQQRVVQQPSFVYPQNQQNNIQQNNIQQHPQYSAVQQTIQQHGAETIAQNMYQQPVQINPEQQKRIAELLAKKNQEEMVKQQQEVADLVRRQQQQEKERREELARIEKEKNDPKNIYKQQLLTAAAITFDPFYSPILEKIDEILLRLGFNDEVCKEKLICSMYKNPEKYSPHSNLLSSELSRDAKELEKPKTTNAAVIRFYKYVQAARDGQDKRDCARLYPTCSINTEEL